MDRERRMCLGENTQAIDSKCKSRVWAGAIEVVKKVVVSQTESATDGIQHHIREWRGPCTVFADGSLSCPTIVRLVHLLSNLARSYVLRVSASGPCSDAQLRYNAIVLRFSLLSCLAVGLSISTLSSPLLHSTFRSATVDSPYHRLMRQHH